MTKCAIFLSGKGSNFVNIIEKINLGKLSRTKISIVISNNRDCGGIQKAADYGLDTFFIDKSTDYNYLEKILNRKGISLLILAGFMKILPTDFVDKFSGKIINLHPSLLPKYKGLNTHEKALEAKDKYHGASVHFVNSRLDDGPIIIQSKCIVDPNDTCETLKAKVHKIEYEILPIAIDWYCKKYIKQVDDKIQFKDNVLDKPIIHL